MSLDYFTRVQASAGWSRILESFARFVEPQPGMRTLDAGCGPGALVRHLARLGCQAAGVDSDPAMVAKARDLAAELEASPEGGGPWAGTAEFHTGAVQDLPFEADTFDLVTATNVLFLLDEPLAGLSELARVCRPGGTVAVLNPTPRLSQAAAEAHAVAAGLQEFEAYSLAKWGRVAEAHRRFSPADMAGLFAEAGLVAPTLVEKVGPGFALYAKGGKPGRA
jgi:ubiquinone/menaquinone biosynthesis C-methylase UbiE